MSVANRRGCRVVRNETWLEILGDELRARGMADDRSVEVVVETETFLADSGEDAIVHFGSPDRYAMELCDQLAHPEAAPAAHRDQPPLVEVMDLYRTFRSKPVLSGISFRLQPGELLVLVGPNGAGKSTLLRIVAGLDRPDRGSVIRCGRIGYTPQQGGLDPYLRPLDHFKIFGGAIGLGSDEAVRRGQHLAAELRWTVTPETEMAKQLSGGTQRKLNVVTALLTEPDVLVLDEPYQGMDGESSRRLWALLSTFCAGGGAVVLSTHQTDALSRADTVIELGGAHTCP